MNTKQAASSQKGWDKLAHLISEITNPVLIAFPTFLLIAIRTAPDLRHALLWWVVTVGGISVAPLLFILRGVRRGHYTDHHVSKREQRLIPLLFSICCTGLVFVILLVLHASITLIATVLAVLIAGGIAFAITRYWKISFHLIGMAGAITVVGLVYGPVFFLLFPLIIIVGWARWRVQAHTPLQALAGTAIAISVTVSVFGLFHLL
ncbi:hypothetical protein [Tengunoibacter tsumagoiensis]|uniref:Phosphatidic acid phosphatase type 2/haloperoxidase domain-containing protein n=1 Tax=Tengunoibacter tsumagoiensis TaxID=2014871 RepID=A0A402A648_9CHLR|nr:hypothetical protein [Tengunoibacter tsumagoiensis]GCE14559.1 hypothetical protein KTT_44180 [Tengunoibacter tsumagoiensis]